MNPKLYTDEFRTFKFLKCTEEQVEYFKTATIASSRIQPWEQEHDPFFFWPHRVEFTEQLLDLRYDTIYIVFAGILSGTNEYEAANLITVEHPLIVNHNPIIYTGVRDATLDDVQKIEDEHSTYCLCGAESYIPAPSGRIFNGTGDNRVFRMSTMPVVPGAKSDFTEIFYDKSTAEKYKLALTTFLRKHMDAVSSFAKVF